MSTRDRAERILSRELAGHHELYGPDEIAADVADALDRAGLLARETEVTDEMVETVARHIDDTQGIRTSRGTIHAALVKALNGGTE